MKGGGDLRRDLSQRVAIDFVTTVRGHVHHTDPLPVALQLFRTLHCSCMREPAPVRGLDLFRTGDDDNGICRLVLIL
jgi:hypothetical protein